MIKKVYVALALILVFTMAFLAGCKGSGDGDSNEKNTEAETTLVIEETGEETEETVAETEGIFEGFKYGHWEDNVYINEDNGIRLTVPDEQFHVSTPAELADYLGLDAEGKSDDEIIALMHDQPSVIDVIVSKPDGSQHMMIMYDSVGASTSPEEYLNAAANQVAEQYKSEGATDDDIILGTPSIGTIGPTQYYMTTITVISDNTSILNQRVYCKQNEGFKTVIIFTSANGEMSEMINMFE